MSEDSASSPESSPGVDVSGLRRDAPGRSLNRKDLHADPFCQFEDWFVFACNSTALDPNAMSLSTIDDQHRPSSRTVLLKYFDERGFVFFTNLSSRKASQIGGNANVSLLFFWPEFGRQIGVRGTAERISNQETLKYFMSRPRGSQIGAWVSAQSSVISSRSLLELKFDEMKRKFANKKVPLPTFWGGYRVDPREIEFWQGRTNRLHDRFLYSKSGTEWTIERLAP